MKVCVGAPEEDAAGAAVFFDDPISEPCVPPDFQYLGVLGYGHAADPVGRLAHWPLE